MTDEPLVKGSWPLVTMDGDRPLWHIAGTNPPQYAIDEKLEALWRASADLRESHENTMAPLKAPFPYFGGKSRIASMVWERFGRVSNFVEPFFGSGAVLLGCPHPGHTETVNDADGLLANFWRALAADPDQVAHYADWPVNEADLHARHRWLVDRRSQVEALLADPEWYDAKAAGWWVWGICQWIGTGWCPTPAGVADVGKLYRKLPHVGNAGRGVHRASDAHALPQKLPHVGNAGRGVHRVLSDLSARLRRTRVCCGDFDRVLGPSVTFRHGMTAVFLDPPYADAEHAVTYSGGMGVWDRATAWCEANGDNPLLRIALCGYAETWQAPAGWMAIPWKAQGGYGSQGTGRGRANATREVVWFSPHCLGLNALPMFANFESEAA